MWVYTGCGLPYDYATDEYGYGALGSRTGSIMQNRVMAPITHESWYVEHNARWTSIHEKLVNYICDAASLQFRRFIGIAHDDSFRTTKMLILEAFLPVINHNYRQWASFYSSLRFKQAPWFQQSANDLRFVCDPDPEGMLSNFTFYGTGGGNNAQQMVTDGCPTPGETPDAEHLYVDATQVIVMKELGGPYPLIPLARPGQIGTLSFVRMVAEGW